MNIYINSLNQPGKTFSESKNLSIAKKYRLLLWVILTILTNSVLEPILQYKFSDVKRTLPIGHMLYFTAMGLVFYFVITIILWLVCKMLGSKMNILDHIAGWAYTFFPTFLCSITVAFTEVFFRVFWNNKIIGMLINFIFVGILIWKLILYFIYLGEFAKLKGKRFVGAFLIIGFIIWVLAAVEGFVGLKTPVI